MRTFVTMILALMLLWPLGSSLAQDARQGDALIIGGGSGLQLTSEATLGSAPASLDACQQHAPEVSALALSPSGRYLAYGSYPAGFAALLDQGWGGPAPAEWHVCDLQTNQETRVFAQPGDYDVAAGRFTLVGHADWSPDGNRLAMATLAAGTLQPALHIYDLNTGALTTINEALPQPAGVPRPPDVQWGSSGIVIVSNTFFNDQGTYLLTVFDAAGTQLDQVEVPNIAEQGAPVEHLIVQRAGGEVVVLPHVSGNIDYYDLATRSFAPATGVIQVRATQSGVLLNYLPNLGVQGATWNATFADGTSTVLPFTGLATSGGIGISPSGQTVAFVGEGRVQVWQRGVEVASVALDDSPAAQNARVTWAPLVWEVVEGGFGG